MLTAVDGTALTDLDQLAALTVTRRPGDIVRLTYRRSGQSADALVRLAALPGPVAPS